jgi:hypothetical protein
MWKNVQFSENESLSVPVKRDGTEGSNSHTSRSRGFGGHVTGRGVTAKIRRPAASLFTVINTLLRLVVLKCCGTQTREDKGYGGVLHNSESIHVISE